MSDDTRQTVLMVSHTSFLGGAERSLAELAVALNEGGAYRPVVACPAEGALPRWLLERGIDVAPYRAPRLERQRHWALARQGVCLAEAIWTLRRHIVRTGAKLLHANGLKALLVANVAARWTRIPCVFHLRDYPRHPHVLKTLAGQTQAMIAPSVFLAEAYRKIMPDFACRVEVISNPVAPLTVDAAAGQRFRAEFGIPPGVPVVAMLAQCVPWKRHDLLLEAAALLRRKLRELRVVIAGSDPWGTDGPYGARLRTRSTYPDLNGRVLFVDFRDDAGAVLAAADALVLPSEDEPFGRVIVEAWWVGIPAVVTDQGGPAELVRDGVTGLHFERGHAAELAEAIVRVLTDETLRAAIIANGRKAAECFRPERHARAITAVYRGACP